MLMNTRTDFETYAVGAGYQPNHRRGFALLLTALVFCLPVVLIGLLSWHAVAERAPAVPNITAFDIATPAPPQEVSARDEPETLSEPVPVVMSQPSPPAPDVLLIEPSFSAPATTAATTEHTAAPVPVPQAPPLPKRRPSGGEQGTDNWHARVLGRLNALKTYPASARARRQRGTTLVGFALDRKGQVLSVTLHKTSGFALLDREALALPRRTSPLPPPPDDVAGDRIELVVPVEFYF
ncbi:MAG: energy transducer TonB [Novosphingobium sp.]